MRLLARTVFYIDATPPPMCIPDVFYNAICVCVCVWHCFGIVVTTCVVVLLSRIDQS
jgi:hypothetical protein